MISIIILLFLVRSIGRSAQEQGEKPMKWKIRVILAWILGDLVGESIVLYFFGFDLILLSLFGPGMAYLGYLLVKQSLDKLENLPDESE